MRNKYFFKTLKYILSSSPYFYVWPRITAYRVVSFWYLILYWINKNLTIKALKNVRLKIHKIQPEGYIKTFVLGYIKSYYKGT